MKDEAVENYHEIREVTTMSIKISKKLNCNNLFLFILLEYFTSFYKFYNIKDFEILRCLLQNPSNTEINNLSAGWVLDLVSITYCHIVISYPHNMYFILLRIFIVTI